MKLYLRSFLFLLTFLSVFAVSVFGQTITIGTVDPGPYAPGSSIAVPITVSGSCISTSNIYTLYISDATGSFSSEKAIGTFSGFYTTYVNGTIPTTPDIIPSSNYKLRVKSSSPVVISSNTSALNIVAGTAVVANINGSSSLASGIYGTCNPNSANPFRFNYSDLPSGGSLISISFFNETSQSLESTLTTTSGQFVPNQANYTIIQKAGNGTTYGTKAYTLINNLTNVSLGTSGSNSACLPSGSGGVAVLTYSVDVNALKANFPGDTYQVSWGDGSATSIYTLCDILNNGNSISHPYTRSSCGNTTTNGKKNVFEVSIQPVNTYCGAIGSSIFSYPSITVAPTNSISSLPNNAVATNTLVTFNNTSDPGQDPTTGSCTNTAARYDWYIDNNPTPIQFDKPLSYQLTTSFSVAGTHKIRLELVGGSSLCGATAFTYQFCVQDSPTPTFTIPNAVCLSGGTATVTPANTFAINNTCFNNPYLWTVKNGNTVVTTSTQVNPNFTFTSTGTYTIDLTVTDADNKPKNAPQQKVLVNGIPTATFTKTAITYCGQQQLTFDNTTGSNTRITYTGTADPTTATYLWTITPSGGAAAASFAAGSDASKQYPVIKFPGVGSYAVTVQYTNSCGTTTSNTETITIQQAPTVTADPNPSETVCYSAGSFQLTGSISDMSSVQSYKWTSNGDGYFTPSAPSSSLTPVYTFGANDMKGLSPVKITLDVTTNLVGGCGDIQQSFNLNITPPDKLTSAASGQICSENHFNYTIKTTNSGATYNWTTTVQSGTVTGLSASGSGSVINDDPVNTSATTDAVVRYTITSTTNGCQSTLTYTLTVHPKPILTGVSPTATICSGAATGIALPTGMNYTWTASLVSGSASGYTQKTAAGTATAVNDVLTNTGTTDAVIKYTITPYGSSGSCPGTSVVVDVTVHPLPTVANAGTSVAICAQTTYTLGGNQPLVGTGKWTEKNNLPVTFADDTKYNTTVTNLVPGTTYNFVWTISPSNGCGTPSNSTVVITDSAMPDAGTISGTATVCAGSNTGIVKITGNTGNVIRWEQTVNNGSIWTTVPGTNTNTSYTYNNLSATTWYRAVVVNGACATPVTSAAAIITVNQPAVQPDAGTPQILCNQTSTTLQSGNNAVTGQWTSDPSNAPGVVITSPNSLTTTVTGLRGGNVYKFIWTVNGNPPCANLPASVTITNNAAIANNTIKVNGQSNTLTVCSGAVVTLDGPVATGGDNTTYGYLWESSTDNGLTWRTVSQTQNTTAGVTVATAFRRTVSSGNCNDISTPVIVNISAPVSNNVLPISVATCYNTTLSNPILGSQPHGGDDVNFTYQWQQSTNPNNGFTDINGATGKDYQPTRVFTTDIYYRRVVTTTFCNGAAGSFSAPVRVIVNPDVIANFTANATTGCTPFVLSSTNIVAVADPNANNYIWTATKAGVTSTIGTGISFPGYTIPTDGTTVTITLTVQSKDGCKDNSISKDFSTPKNVTAAFTASNTVGCGPQTATFTNTSSALTGVVFTWDFGDGSAKYTGTTPPAHTFQPDATGNDALYTVTLTATVGTCSITTATQKITVYPAAPKAYIDPGASTGCAPYTITVKNITPGTNSGYVFTLYDETNRLVQTINKTNNDKSDAVFAAINTVNTVTYTVKMVTTNLCGASTQSAVVPIVITSTGISARMAVSPLTNTGIAAGCAPFLANFQNLSTGGNSYVYNIYDANFNPIKSIPTTGNISYNFDVAGTYYVSIGVFSSCSTGIESPKTKITVYPVAAPAFAATTPTTGCTQLIVSLKNTTPDISPAAPATTFIYTWDFGDGSTFTGYAPPPHSYDYKRSPYTVTLSVVNSNGCSSTTTKAGFIVVNPPPLTDFWAQPDTITSIPNYSFAFVDKTKNQPVSWLWDFGDGTTSNRQNPTHTYADTGRYKVTLTTTTQYGCTDSKTHTARVAGVPGQLYVPNAFMPTSLSQELRVFTVKGSGIKSWDMRIMNNWGQVIFETTRLSTKGEPIDFWDGKYKGQDVPQGAYAWEITAHFINGTDWGGMSYRGSAPRRSGTLTLIR